MRRTISVTVFVLLCTYFLFSLRAWQWEIYWRVATLYIGALGSLWAYVWLRQGRSTAAVSHMCMMGAWVACFGSTYSSGGAFSAASTWFFVVPLIAGLMGGLKVALIWGWLVGLSLIGVMLLTTMGWVPPDQTPVGQQFSQNVLLKMGQYLVITLLLISYLRQVAWSDQQLDEHIEQLNTENHIRRLAEVEAQRANRAKTDFLASMSHELRTPLNSIIGFSHRLLKRRSQGLGLTEERDDYSLKGIHNNGKVLLQFINELLDISKLESGHMELELEPIELRPFLLKLLGDLQGMADSQGVKLRLDGVAVDSLEADKKRLRQIIVNLISNGLKYTECGEVVVSCMAATGDRVCISVIDTGVGIAEEDLPTLFDPYTNINHAHGKTVDSTGLGLSLCQRLVMLHGGTIEVQTCLGEGSRFQVFLPVKSTHATEVRGPSNVTPEVGTPPPSSPPASQLLH